jgi:hypothetical protein
MLYKLTKSQRLLQIGAACLAKRLEYKPLSDYRTVENSQNGDNLPTSFQEESIISTLKSIYAYLPEIWNTFQCHSLYGQ